MNKKILLFIALAVVVIGAIVFVAIYQNSRNKELSASIVLEVVPSGAKSTINGRGVREGTTKLKPGIAEVVITKKGFETARQTVVLKEGESKYLGFVLVSNSPSTADWYQKHPEDAKRAENLSSLNYDQVSADDVKETPFILKLPFISSDEQFRVDYGQSETDSNQIVIYISANSQEARNAALEWIRSVGYDPSTLNIVYIPKK